MSPTEPNAKTQPVTKDKEVSESNFVGMLLHPSRSSLPRPLVLFMVALCTFFWLFCLYTLVFGTIDVYAHVMVPLSMALVLSVFFVPLKRKWNEKLNWASAIDLLCAVAVIFITVYILIDYSAFRMRPATPTTLDLICGSVYIAVVLWLTWHAVSRTICLLVGFFMLQNYFGPYLPGFLGGAPIPFRRIIQAQFMAGYGIFGDAAGAYADILVIDLLFGSLLLVGGGGRAFIDIAAAVAGQFRGGAAKISVLGSAGVGTMMGAPTANAVTVGSVTIPLMKSVGYKAHFAAAVESVASCGGQIMPPVMGVSAFLIAQFGGWSYGYICLVAIIPALLYFEAVYFAVDFEAARTGLKGLPREQCPRLLPALAKWWPIFIPLIVLIALLMSGVGPSIAGVWAVFTLIGVTFFKKETRLTPTKLLVAFEDGARTSANIGVACAAIGIALGAFWLSGFGNTISSLIITGSGGVMVRGLLICAVVALVLGMGMPTMMVYMTVLLVAIPSLIAMGSPPIVAHFFAFFWGCFAPFTPPVAITAIATAGIAGASMIKTGYSAMRIAGMLYLIPFMFAVRPELLLQGSVPAIAGWFVLAAISVMAGSACIFGYFVREANLVDRVVLGLAAAGFFVGHFTTMWIGYALTLAGLAVAALIQRTKAPSESREAKTT